jgi:5-methylcytosine-specific restriction endonuclease McrBC regulatory subunit McrC
VVRQVVHLVGGWVRRPELWLRLRRIDAILAEVTPTTMPASAISRFTYHRLNDSYQPIHRPCRLFLEDASLSEAGGPFDFRAFLVDMNRLFEAFVTEILRERAPAGTTVRARSQLFLGVGKKVEMRTDLMVDADGTTVLVADCKCKRLEPDQYRHHDVYQLLASLHRCRGAARTAHLPGTRGADPERDPAMPAPPSDRSPTPGA